MSNTKKPAKKLTKKAAAPVKPGRKEAKDTALTVTLRLTRDGRDKLDQLAERSGVSANALMQQLLDRYGHKLDLGQRLDTIEALVGQLEYELRELRTPASTLATQGLSAKLVENHERVLAFNVSRENDGTKFLYSAAVTLAKPSDARIGNEAFDEIASQGDTFLDAITSLNEAVDLFFANEAAKQTAAKAPAADEDEDPEDGEKRDDDDDDDDQDDAENEND